MPRSGRVVLPDTPHHVIQRGHNRQVVFTAHADYLYYLENLAQCRAKFGCKVFAYCLMTNHVHLVIDPGEEPRALGRLMKRVAGRQTRYVNRLENRTGSLWEGRYRSSPIQTDGYLLACCRYVELNPVRACLTGTAGDYRWSSYAGKVGAKYDPLIDPDPCYLALSDDPAGRADRYRRWVDQAIPEGEWAKIRRAVRRGQLTGEDRFVAEVEQKLGRRIEDRGRGRPTAAGK